MIVVNISDAVIYLAYNLFIKNMQTPKSTLVNRGQSAKNDIINTVTLANDVVCSTLGPGGANVLVQTDQGSKITKDGVSVLMSIVPENPFENAVLNVLKDACMKTNKNAGDGTTSTVALISNIVLNAINRRDGLNGIQIRNGLMLAANEIVRFLREQAIAVADLNTNDGENQLRQIAKISTNNDEELSNMIVEIFKKCGKTAKIKLDFSNTATSEYTINDGFQLPKGYLSTYFADDSGVVTMENPDIYISEKTIANMPELLPVINTHMQMDKPFIIIAPKFELSVLNSLVMYKLRGLKVCCILLAEFGVSLHDTLLDVAVLTGATMISEQTGVSFRTTDVVVPGSAKTVIIEDNKTTIIEGCGTKESVTARIDYIKNQIKACYDPQYKITLQQRLDNIEGGVATLAIGGNTAARARERYDLADDAIHACKASLESGFLPGAGSALLQCKFASKVDAVWPFNTFFEKINAQYDIDSATRYGVSLMFDVCDIISKRVIVNALSADTVYELQHKLLETGVKNEHAAAPVEFNFVFKTFNLKTAEIDDALTLGIIDPLDVIVNEVLNAAEAAGTLLTMESIIVNVPKKMDISETLTGLAT